MRGGIGIRNGIYGEQVKFDATRSDNFMALCSSLRMEPTAPFPGSACPITRVIF
jgi:hypothetical protein